MATVSLPPVIMKEREAFFGFSAQVRSVADQFRTTHLRDDAKERNTKLKKFRDELDAGVRVFLEGEWSIEKMWRDICAWHEENKCGATEGERARMEELFDMHLANLRQIEQDELYLCLEQDGFAVPSFREIPLAIDRTEEYRRRILERWPLSEREFAYGFPVDVEEVVYISPTAFLRSAAMIVWSAFRHPFSTSYIDLSTGRSVTRVDESVS